METAHGGDRNDGTMLATGNDRVGGAGTARHGMAAAGGGAAEDRAQSRAVSAEAQRNPGVRPVPALRGAQPVQSGLGDDQSQGLVRPLRRQAEIGALGYFFI